MMKNGWSVVGSIVAAALLAAGCSAASQTEPGTTGPEPTTSAAAAVSDDGMRGPGVMFGQADTNKDGLVTIDEFKATIASRFATADANHDGQIDQQELRAMREAHRGGPGFGGQHRNQAERDAQHARIDRDGNGMVSRDEAPPRLAERFDQVDTNHDGVLDQAELRAARPERPNGPPGDRADGPGRPGGGPMARADTNGDGMLTLAEMTDAALGWFHKLDSDGDGTVKLSDLAVRRPRRGPR